MAAFDAIENDRRIRDGIISVIANKTVEFSKENANLIAIFEDPFTKFSGGRVILFQEYVQELTGIVPIFLKSMPACLKIFFKLSLHDSSNTEEIFKALESPDSKEFYRSIGVSQLQYAGKLIVPSP